MSFRFSAIAIAMFTLLAACGQRDARFNPSHFVDSKPEAPPEVVLPAHAQPGAKTFGLTIGGPGNGDVCCLASAHADLPVRKSASDSVLVVSVYTPVNGQRLRIAFADGTTRWGPPLAQGFGLIRVPAPAALAHRGGTTRVRINAKAAPYILLAAYFEPAKRKDSVQSGRPQP